ncbi:hypothetical protein ACFSLT_23160 [Novosphingobium resinovorum]
MRSLTRAQALVRRSNAGADVTVLLGDGAYRLDAPLAFRRADGGQGGHSVTWKAAAGAHPVISGGMTVTGFKPYDAERRVFVADVPKGLDSRQLWIDGTLGERPWVELRAADVTFDATGFTVVNPKLDWLSTLARPDRVELEATGFFTDRVSPVKGIAGSKVTMQQPAWDNNTWGYDTISKPIFPDDSRLFLVGAPEFIGKANDWHSRPYQWAIDPQAGKLYLRVGLDEDIAGREVVVPRLEALVSIAGTPEAPVEHLRFEGCASRTPAGSALRARPATPTSRAARSSTRPRRSVRRTPGRPAAGAAPSSNRCARSGTRCPPPCKWPPRAT